MDNFDPIKFLELKIDDLQFEETLRKDLNHHMIWYVVNCFLDKLPDDKVFEIEKSLNNLKSYSDVIDIIQCYDRDFETNKFIYLNNYKKLFNFDEFKQKVYGNR